MPKIFVSYRREDSSDVTGRIYDRLLAHFGSGSVFIDVDSIPLGVDFRSYLGDWVGRCDVLLAIIGADWRDIRDAGGNVRLGQPDDFVTIEIAAAIERKIPVIPVLVGKAVMPTQSELPRELAELVYRNAAEVRSGRDFHSHVDRLIRGIERHGAPPPAVVAPFPAAAVREETSAVAGETAAVYVVVEPPAVARPTNLGFERVLAGGLPTGWFNSLGFVSGISTQYDIQVEPRESQANGRCVRMSRSGGSPREFGSLMQRCAARNLAGVRVRLEAELRTDRLEAWAGLWLRIDDDQKSLFFDNMHDRPIRGTTPWTRYAIEADLPAASEWLNYGVLLAANGDLWADNFQVSCRGAGRTWEAV